MNKLAKRPITLPENIEELKKFVLIGRDKLISVRAYIRAMDKLGVAKAVREQKREEANMLAGALLDAEARMGELLPPPKSKRNDLGQLKGEKTLPDGITKQQADSFRTLANNKDIIEDVKADAEADDDLPTRTEVLRRVKEKEKENRDKQPKPELPKGIYKVIYADPPWQFSNSGLAESADSHYSTMPTDDICAMPIKKLCCKDTVLFMWATNAMLEDALRVVKAWGFNYKSNLVWIKDKGPSIGWFTVSRHELLLIATAEGNLHPTEKVNSWTKAEVSKHSKKPEVFYTIIEKMYNGPYIELFARNKREGWGSFGNQISEG
jgi:site-specific DNA-methyltransferase (adenine-specific)